MENNFDGVSSIDLQIFNCHNEVRADPSSFIPDLEAMLENYTGE